MAIDGRCWARRLHHRDDIRGFSGLGDAEYQRPIKDWRLVINGKDRRCCQRDRDSVDDLEKIFGIPRRVARTTPGRNQDVIIFTPERAHQRLCLFQASLKQAANHVGLFLNFFFQYSNHLAARVLTLNPICFVTPAVVKEIFIQQMVDIARLLQFLRRQGSGGGIFHVFAAPFDNLDRPAKIRVP